jgi:hypothetical protein
MESDMSIKSFISSLEIGAPWDHLGLAVHPLIGTSNGKASYLTLDEALKTGQFQIGEVSMAGAVPELKVYNRVSQTVLLLDGEELIGAKQNRVVNLTIMVPADTELTIPVSCVEAGRWRHISDTFAAADRAQFSRSRARKLAQVSYSLRESGGRHSDQTDIWNEIAAKSARMSATSPTGAMAAIYERSQTQLGEYIKAMPRLDRQVGAVFSICGQIAGVDVFDCADTFAKAAPKLIRSYAIDAMERHTAGLDTGPSTNAIRAFLDEITNANVTRFKAVGLGDDLRLNSLALAGAGLKISGQIVHLVAFPALVYENNGESRHGYTRMSRPRVRRALF